MPENYYWDGIDAEVAAAARGAVRLLGDLGARVIDLRLPDPQVLVDVTSLIARGEERGGPRPAPPRAAPRAPARRRAPGWRSASGLRATTISRRLASGRG